MSLTMDGDVIKFYDEGGLSIKINIKYLTTLIIILTISMFVQGCEDDPLLAPQTGSEEDKGSYGNLVPLQDFEEEIREKNPEIF